MAPTCTSCKIIVWPPSSFCSRCLRETVWEKAPTEGVVLEFSKQGAECFCVAEMGNSFRIIGKITDGIPRIGQGVRLQRCGIREGLYFFDMSLLG